MNSQGLLEPFLQVVRMKQISHSQGVSRGSIFVTWTNASSRGADFIFRQKGFAGLIEGYMIGKKQRGTIANKEFERANTCFFDVLYFFEQSARIDHHAIGDDVSHFFMQNATRQKPQGITLFAMDDTMPGIIPPLRTNDNVTTTRKIIGYLAFSFIAPLHSFNRQTRHKKIPPAFLWRIKKFLIPKYIRLF